MWQWGASSKIPAREPEGFCRWREHAQIAEETLQRFVAGGRPEIEEQALHIEFTEHTIQQMVFDFSGERSATHRPSGYPNVVWGAAAQQDGDPPQWSELVAVGNGDRDGAIGVQGCVPLRLRHSRTVQVELIGLVDEFQIPLVGGGESIIDFDAAAERSQEFCSGSAVIQIPARRPKCFSRAKARCAQYILGVDLLLAKQLAQLSQKPPNCGGIARSKSKAGHLGK